MHRACYRLPLPQRRLHESQERGEGFPGLDLNSGWNCELKKNLWPGISAISILLSLLPANIMPLASIRGIYLGLTSYLCLWRSIRCPAPYILCASEPSLSIASQFPRRIVPPVFLTFSCSCKMLSPDARFLQAQSCSHPSPVHV